MKKLGLALALLTGCTSKAPIALDAGIDAGIDAGVPLTVDAGPSKKRRRIEWVLSQSEGEDVPKKWHHTVLNDGPYLFDLQGVGAEGCGVDKITREGNEETRGLSCEIMKNRIFYDLGICKNDGTNKPLHKMGTIGVYSRKPLRGQGIAILKCRYVNDKETNK